MQKEVSEKLKIVIFCSLPYRLSSPHDELDVKMRHAVKQRKQLVSVYSKNRARPSRPTSQWMQITWLSLKSLFHVRQQRRRLDVVISDLLLIFMSIATFYEWPAYIESF